MNISEHSAAFIQEMIRRNYSKETIKNYASSIRMFMSHVKRDHPKNVNEDDIKTYLALFAEPNTQRSHHSAIKKFYEICLGQKNKFQYIPYCRKSSKLPIVLSVDDVRRMFHVCENLKHKAMMGLLYGCGLRVSELINLKPEHIDSSRMVINVVGGKGKKDRQVMLPEKLLSLLRNYYKLYRPKSFLFNGQFSDQYSSRSVNSFLRFYALKAGIANKKVYAHLMRHTSFTHLMEGGTDINLIQRVAGHSSVKTTMMYCHISHALISKIRSPVESVL